MGATRLLRRGRGPHDGPGTHLRRQSFRRRRLVQLDRLHDRDGRGVRWLWSYAVRWPPPVWQRPT